MYSEWNIALHILSIIIVIKIVISIRIPMGKKKGRTAALDTQSEVSSLGGSVSTYKTNLSDDDSDDICEF